MTPHPWSKSESEITRLLGVDPHVGLNEADVQDRRARYGTNTLVAARPRSLLSMLEGQLKSVVVALLVAAAVLSVALGDVVECVAIAIVIVLNTALGFVTELRAVRSMEALRNLGRAQVVVRRGGSVARIDTEDLVPGDLVVVEAGDILGADLRLIKAAGLEIDESALTGESIATPKDTAAVPESTHVSERRCMAHRGTIVTRGSAEGVVVATGMDTQVGTIGRLVAGAQSRRSPLERRLARLARRLVWISLLLAVILVAVSMAQGRDIALAIKTAVALAVAAIPEGLPIVATLALAQGMWRMAAKNALISRLSAVETLGATSVILTDKTGTLTENKMRVSKILLPGKSGDVVEVSDFAPGDAEGTQTQCDQSLQTALRLVTLCNTASIDGDETGDPTEIALLLAADQHGMTRAALLEHYPERRIDPFNSDRKMMATVNAHGEGTLVAVKGAPEEIIDHCAWVGDANTGQPLSTKAKEQWLKQAEALAGQGFRVIGAASKRTQSDTVELYSDLEFRGLFALWDPPREDVARAIKTCREAGMRVVMVTGDHPATAHHVANILGIATGTRDEAIDGRTLPPINTMDQDELESLLKATVIARSSPEQKLNLIALHQDAGHIVAMTGDGVNDAPALKQADIGVAMGIRGTAVAKQAAAMILMDDAFRTIVEATRLGRAIFVNIRRFVVYLLSCNLSEIMVVGLAALAGAPLPLTPLQILFLNLVTDVFPALALGVNPGDASQMQSPPRPATEPIITRRHWVEIALYGAIISGTVLIAVSIASTAFGLAGDTLTTVCFFMLALTQLWHVFNMRSGGAPWNSATARNPWVWVAIALCLTMLAVAFLVPPIADALSLTAIPLEMAGIILALSLVPIVLQPLVTLLSPKANTWRQR